MQKILLLLLLAALLTPAANAQTNSLPAKWTDDQKVALESLPATGQPILLSVEPGMTQRGQDLSAACQKMSTPIMKWKLSDDGTAFIVELDRNAYPQWTEKDWENYMNRVVSAFLLQG